MTTMTEVLSLYRQGTSLRKLGEITGVSRKVLSRQLKSEGIVVDPRTGGGRPRIHTLNENVFVSLTPDAAYWAGFIMADGCVSNLGQIVVTLSRNDEGHLEKLRTFLGTSAPIYQLKTCGYSDTPGVSLSVRSRKIAADLARLGIVPGKTHSARASAPLCNSPHFWRGVLDGDGWYGTQNSSNKIELVGSQNLCTQFAEWIETLTTKRPQVFSHRSIFRVRLAKAASAVVLKSLFPDPHITCLDRKRIKALMLLEHSNDRRLRSSRGL